jgi:DNA gyrase/topoisomerase IV subunit B
MYKTRDGLTIVKGLEAVQRRPAIYIGAEEPSRSPSHRLLEGIVDAIANDTPPPREIRVGLWSGRAITVAWDGVPLPIEPFDPSGGGVSHPALYQLFMHVAAGTPPFGRFFFGAVLNALSEQLVVSTMHDDHRYRVVFAKGMVVALLQRASCRHPFGTNWFTFRPDTAIIGGDSVTWAGMQHIAAWIGRRGSPRIRVEDHSGEEADW